MDDLMEKLKDHQPGKAYFYQRESTVDTDELMKGMSSRVDDLKAKHEAEREKERQAQENRIRLHPDQYEKLQMEKEALNPSRPDNEHRMSEDEKREAWRRSMKAAERKDVQQTGIPVYNHNGLLVGYKKK